MLENGAGFLVPLLTREQERLVSDHIVYGNFTEMQGTAVYRTRNPFSYVFVKDGEFYSTTAYNIAEGSVPITSISGDWYNGSSYETAVSVVGETRTIKFTLLGAETHSSQLNKYSEFAKLLSKAGLLEQEGPLPLDRKSTRMNSSH